MIVKIYGETFKTVKDVWPFGFKDFEMYLENGLTIEVDASEIISIDGVLIDELMKNSSENRFYTICDFLDGYLGNEIIKK